MIRTTETTARTVRHLASTARVHQPRPVEEATRQVRDSFDTRPVEPTATTEAPMTRMLKRGARGEDVRQLQAKLREAGYDVGPIDGKFGPQTEAAVRAYQQANGLKVDGRAGEDTFRAMGMEYIGRSRRTRAPAEVPEAPRETPSSSEPGAAGDVPPTDAPAATDAPTGVGAADDIEQRRAVARRLVRPGGSGTQEDVDAVVAQLEKMPLAELEQMERNGTKVVACRGSVTDHRTDLQGVQPRGWPPGKTWDDVPGAFVPDRNEVVIATRAAADGSREIPPTGSSHGSANLVLHEAGHAMDHVGGEVSENDAAFKAAYEADQAAMPEYLRQPGEAGRSEAYAESHALYLQDPAECRRRYPNLARYWDTKLNGGQS